METGPTATCSRRRRATYTRKLLANTPSIEVALGNVTAPAS